MSLEHSFIPDPMKLVRFPSAHLWCIVDETTDLTVCLKDTAKSVDSKHINVGSNICDSCLERLKYFRKIKVTEGLSLRKTKNV